MMARASSKPPDPAAIPALVPQGSHAGKQSMPISRPLTVIGSRHRAHLHLLSRTVSKSHAVVGMEAGGVYIRDLASRTHVYVNGKLIRETDLHDGDLVKIGSFTFKYVDKRKSPLLDKPKRPPAAAVEVEGSAVPIEFNGRVMLIGRRPTCDISLMEVSVSTCHAVIFEHNGQRMIRDLGSRTGTYVNGQLIHQTALNVGDQIRIGETEMKLVGHGLAPLHDELEDLVGTAPLGEEMLAIAGEDLQPPPAPKAKPARVKEAPAAAESAPPVPPSRAVPPPVPIPVAAPVIEPEPELEPEPEIELQPEPIAEVEAPEEKAQGASALGVGAAPVVSEPPAIEPEPLHVDAEEPPALVPEALAPAAIAPAAIAPSPPTVAEPMPADSGDVIKIEPDERPHLLVDTNLYTEAMTGSGTFSGISGEVEEANSEAALAAAATEPMDLGLDFWHDDPPAAPIEALQIQPPVPADDAPLPLLGVEEPDDTAFALAAEVPAAEIPIAEAEPALPTAEKGQAASTLGVGVGAGVADEPAVEPAIAPLELGPELTSPAPAAETMLPGLVVPAGAIERAPEAAPMIPPVSEAPAEPFELVEVIDLSNVQFSPPASEPAAEWEADEPPAPAPTSLLGLDVPPVPLEDAPVELSLLPAAPMESADVLDADESENESPTEPAAKPKRKTRRRKTKAAAESAEPTASAEPAPEPTAAPALPEAIAKVEPIAEPAAEPIAFAEPAPAASESISELAPIAELAPEPTESAGPAAAPVVLQAISELGPLVALAAEPTDSYTPPLPLVEPITEAEVAATEPEAFVPFEMPVAEASAPVEPLSPVEESFEPAFELEPLDLDAAGEIELPIENDLEPIAVDDAPEFNFDEPVEEAATADEAGPAWVADAQTLLPDVEAEPTALSPAPIEEPELPLPAINELAEDVEPIAPPIAPIEEAQGASTLGVSGDVPAAPMRLDPFRGMQNDLGSFLGGLPLPLPPVANVPLDDGSSLVFAGPPAVPIEPLDVSEPPPELFDSEPEALDALPESLEKIEDVQQAIGEKQPAGARPGRLPPPPLHGPVKAPFGSTPLSPGPPESPDIIAARKGKSPVTARRGQVTTAFDGLALQPVRQADVFSQMSTPTADEAFALGEDEEVISDVNGGSAPPPIPPPTSLSGALPGAPEPTGRRNSRAYLDRKGLHPLRGGLGGEAVDADLVEADPLAADFGGPGVELKATVSRRVLPAQPTAPSPRFQPVPPPPAPPRFRRRKWVRVGVLLPLMIVIAAAAAAAIWYFVPVTYVHTADLTYTNLDKSTDWQRDIFLKAERDIAGSPDTLKLAQAIYAQNGGKRGAGFLDPNGPIDKREQLNRVLDSMNIPSGTNRLELHTNTEDRIDDALRLNALVHALNTKDAPLKDAAGRLWADFVDKQNRLRDLASKIEQTTNDINAEQAAADRRESLAESYADLDSDVAQLLLKRQAASRHVNDLEQEVHYLETSGAGVSATQPAQAPAPADDPETRDLAAQIDRVQAELATIHSANSSTADQANAALDQALRQFAQQVADAKAKLNNSAALTDYLAAAQQAQDAISKQRAQAAEENKGKQQHLAELKDHLADEQKRQNEAIWAADQQLQTWQQDLEIQQHHYEAASGGGLQDEAAKIKVDIDRLEGQIAARRDQLTAQNPANADITTIRKFIDDWLDSMRKEQERDDQRMADQIQQLAGAAPNLSKLPDDQKALAEALEKQQDQLDKARQQYALALENGPESDAAAKHLESQLADLSAKLSAHRKEVMDQNREISTRAETSALEAQLKEKDEELTAARQAEDAAFLEYAKYKESLEDTKTELDKATALASKKDEDSANLAAMHTDYDSLTDEVSQAADRNAKAVVPLAPPANAVQTSAEEDRRWQYIAGDFGLLFVLSLLVFLTSPPQPRIPLARSASAARPPQSALPPRPSFASGAAPPAPRGDVPVKLTSLTAALDEGAEPHQATDKEPAPDAIPASF